MTRKGRSRLVLTGPQTDCLVGHCHVGQFYLSMARRAYGPPTAKSMACRVREWRWTPRESAILGRRDNALQTQSLLASRLLQGFTSVGKCSSRCRSPFC